MGNAELDLAAQAAAIKEKNAQAVLFLDAIKENPQDFESVYRNLHSFVFARYSLDEDEADSENISELAKASLAKLLEFHKKGMLNDVSNNCVSTSSEIMKKALLIMTLQKNLKITFDPARNDTIEQLAHQIVDLM